MEKKFRILLSVIIAAVLLAGTLTSARAQGGIKPDDKTLVIAQSVDMGTFEPNMINSQAENNVMFAMFATLYEVNHKGEIVPYLAKSYTTSADGKQMTFELNDGLTCHDGSALTADDVAYTFNRGADPANKFDGNTPGFVFDAIKFDGAVAVDKTHVTIKMKEFQPIALGLIAEVFIHCKAPYAKMSLEEAAKTPVGSGPYKFVEWKKDEYVLMEKYPGFTLRPAAFDKVYWRVIPEGSTRVAELLAGNVDITNPLPPDQLKAINDSKVATVAAVRGTRRMYVGFNFKEMYQNTPGGKAIQDTKVRVALQYAVDVPTICSSLLGTDCDRMVSMVNPPNQNKNLTPYPYDPKKAGELLDAAGYPLKDGVRFEITLQGPRGRYLNDANVVQAIGQYLTDVGVKTKVELFDWSTYRTNIQKHEVGPLFFLGTGGDTWSAIYDMADITEPTGSTNYTEWKNPDWFKLWNSLSSALDPAKQKEITDKMAEVFYNDPPWILLYAQPDFFGVSNRLTWTAQPDHIILWSAALKKS